MKTLLSLLSALVLVSGPRAPGAISEVYDFTSLNLAVPDGNPAGLANTQTLASNIVSIESVEVSLALTGTFNGDLFAYLVHDAGFAVLLNRAGSSAASAFGYADDGLIVTLTADAANGDIHVYQNTLTPGPGTPLTGTWQPDGRDTDPNIVTDASPRTALLSSFNSASGSGDWTLFVADLSSGDPHALGSWGLKLTGEPVPEPASTALLLAAFTAALARRWRMAGRVERRLKSSPGPAI
jgi:subtilisin-like proprotein convertase family protein